MTETELKILIAQGESMALEFKRDSPIGDTELLEAVVCLANADGGVLLIGVEDDGTVTGVHQKHQSVLPSQLEASINNRTKPSVQVRAEAVTIGGLLVHVIRVPQAFGIVSTTDGKILKRNLDVHGKPECLPMYPHEYPSRLAHLRRHDHTALPLEGRLFSSFHLESAAHTICDLLENVPRPRPEARSLNPPSGRTPARG
jgi:ATP-dependent DNA helicase RecG